MKETARNRKFPAADSEGFTLLELIVAQAIFLILLVVVVQLILGVTQTAQGQKNKMDALGEARQALDRISLDWSARVRRSDITGSFLSQTGNDQLSLLSQVSAYQGTRPLTWVTYRVNPTTYALERGVAGYNWASTDPAPDNELTFPFAPPATSASTFETLAGSVFRLEFCFMQQVQPNATPAVTNAYTVNPALNLNSPTLTGVVVTIAVLDQQNRKIISNTQLASLTAALHDAPEGQDPLSLWTGAINNPNFSANAGIPKNVASAVHVYQRILYVRE